MLQVVTGDPRPIYRQIVDGVRRPIASGELPVGAALPSVRGLAHQLTVNPNTVAEAYTELTTESWLDARAGLPPLTMVHGGPRAAFDGGYNTLVQLLVHRGNAVFQLNLRASTGDGENYTRAPKGEFGNGRVQADIIEGVNWLVANGVGGPRRLAIMGDSCGRYSTLLALTHTLDLFQFGIAMSPPPDFEKTMRGAAGNPAGPGEGPLGVQLIDYGVDLGDAALMKRIAATSPAANAGKVSTPLLIIAGGKDKMVSIAAITDDVATLQGAGKLVSLLVEPDEGHMPREPLTRQACVYLLQRMLHQHLGGPAVGAPSPELAKFLQQMMRANGAMAL